MAQHDMNIANQSFPNFRTDLNNALTALNTMHSGTNRPSGAAVGTLWLDTTNSGSNSLEIKFFDGTDDISFATVDTSANTINFIDSTVSVDIVSDTSPQLGGDLDTNSANIKIDDAHGILDDDGNEQIIFQKTASAVNQFDITNAATGNNPSISATGDDTNIGITLTPKGTGEIVIAAGDLNYGGTAVTSTGAELNKLDGAGTLKQAGKETIWIPAVAMYPNTTNGCAALAQVELSNAPEIKTLDFDKSSDEFAQFAVAFPKSWNEGTITFQAYFTADSTDTGTTSWALQGVALADNDSLNTAFGTAVAPTAKAHSGTANDLNVTAESGAVTIAGSPSTDEYVFFQIFRDVSADDLDADAKLLGIKLFYTTDAANDA
tara:strand:+ start:1431 stop:2561 length:1131 start_codon:yes stop_codon:yes gene_type:complete